MPNDGARPAELDFRQPVAAAERVRADFRRRVGNKYRRQAAVPARIPNEAEGKAVVGIVACRFRRECGLERVEIPYTSRKRQSPRPSLSKTISIQRTRTRRPQCTAQDLRLRRPRKRRAETCRFSLVLFWFIFPIYDDWRVGALARAARIYNHADWQTRFRTLLRTTASRCPYTPRRLSGRSAQRRRFGLCERYTEFPRVRGVLCIEMVLDNDGRGDCRLRDDAAVRQSPRVRRVRQRDRTRKIRQPRLSAPPTTKPPAWTE